MTERDIGISVGRHRRIETINDLDEKRLDEIAKVREENKKTIVQGDRGDKFKAHIISILEIACIRKEHYKLYLDRIELFSRAYTSKTANPKCNYEALEFLGDSVCNFVLVQYMFKKFPQLSSPDGSMVKIGAQMKIKYASTRYFSQFAEQLGMLPFITASRYALLHEKKNLLEDVFEALMGALMTIATESSPGDTLPSTGPHYRILKYLFDPLEISLNFEDLSSSKTNLKVYLEQHNFHVPSFKSTRERDPDTNIFTFYVSAVVFVEGRAYRGNGSGRSAKEAEEEACKDLLEGMKKVFGK